MNDEPLHDWLTSSRGRVSSSGCVLAGGRVGELKADDGVSRQPFEVQELHGAATTFYHTTDLVVVPREEAPACGAACPA